jgi:hypothetical protein
MPADETLQDRIRETVREFLIEDQWQLGELSGPDLAWGHLATDRQGRKLVVAQRKERTDEILLQARVSVHENTQAQLRTLIPEDRKGFLWDMRMALMQMNVDFNGISDDPTNIRVVSRIFFDGMSKDVFFQRLSEVRRALLTILWMLNRKFEDQPPPTTSESPGPPLE